MNAPPPPNIESRVRRLALVVVLAACGCADARPAPATAKPWPGRCEVPTRRTAQHVTSGDYQRLLPFRSYVRVARVGPYVQHVTVWYGCVEGNVARFEVSSAGDVTPMGSAWGGLAIPPKAVPPIPDEGRAAVERVRAWFARVAPDAGISLVRYDGAYRDVTLVALEPMDPAGPQERMGAGAYVTVGADDALTKVVHPSGGEFFDLGLLCGSACGDPPKWLSLSPAATSLAAIHAMTKDPSHSLLVREALEQIRLQRTASLDALLANQDEANALPRAGLPSVFVSMRLFTKGRANESTLVRVPIDVGASAGGVAWGETSVELASRRLRLRARVSIDAPLSDGALHAPLNVEVEVDDGDAPSLVLPTKLDAVGVVERGRFALVAVAPRPDTMHGDRLLDPARQLWASSPRIDVIFE